MEKRVFGKTGMSVTVLGFGGAEIGYQGATPATVKELLNSALDAGLNVIDTAECYVNSEEMIGDSVSNRRSEYYLFTKVGHPNGSFQNGEDWSKKGITASIDSSLKKLRTDHLDLVQLHSCSRKILEKGDAIEALQEAKRAGKTKFIGYSGDGQDAVYAINTGAFDTLQTSVSILDQEVIDLTLPLARERGMGVIAKRPIGNAVWRFKELPPEPYIHPYWQRLQHLHYDVISIANGDPNAATRIALNFTLQTEGVHTAIVGTTKPGRWKENAKLVEQPISRKEYDEIRRHWKENAKPDWVGQV
jgi:aryl-alcohol dehydrogenase-like predicted oxidoreductase